MTEQSTDTIWIVSTEETEKSKPTRSGRSATERVATATQISVQTLEDNMGKFLQVVTGIFKRADREAEKQSGMQLEEIELSVEITGSGEIKLIGSGVSTEAKGAIKLTFKRVDGWRKQEEEGKGEGKGNFPEIGS